MLAKKQSKAIEPSDGEVISCGMTAAQAVIEDGSAKKRSKEKARAARAH